MTLSQLLDELNRLDSEGYGEYKVVVVDLDDYETEFDIIKGEHTTTIYLEAR